MNNRKPKSNKKTQAFKDGLVSIYSVGEIAQPGNMPKNGLNVKLCDLRFEKRTVGIKRYWAAKQNNVKIDKVIRTPLRENITTKNIAVLPDGQYEIKHIQYPPDTDIPTMELSLERLEKSYEIG